MPTIPDAPFSMVANSALPITATTTILAAFITPAVAAATIHYASPQRLTEVLIAALSRAENTYVDVLQMGLLSVTETEALYTLQRKVSAIHVATMRDSLSWRAGLQGFFKGRYYNPNKLLGYVHSGTSPDMTRMFGIIASQYESMEMTRTILRSNLHELVTLGITAACES
ncbi:hypothetical protein B0H13DRAFT_2292330 [Mycena leptocephala]|nr:hypothetical protein B0H13DRAFT_2292330 [Mycena leptocephala]